MNFKKIIFFISAFFSLINAVAQTTVVDSILINGIWRNYRLFLPTNFNSSQHLPLVFNFHGYGSNALEQEAYSGFDSVADTARVIVCYPNGLANAWNVTSLNSGDVLLVDELITQLQNEYNINLNRVYSTGLSNGGFMSNLLGCRLANRIAAIAPVAGTNLPAIQDSCLPSRFVPVLYIHGTSDAIVNYNGAIGYSSAAQVMDLWSELNNCSPITDTVLLPDISPNDLCRAERISWQNCDSNKHVVHYRIIDGGHTWPGAPFIIGVTNQDIVASQIIWEFFNQHSLNTDVEELSALEKTRIYPNPFNNFLDIELYNSSKSIIEIFSADGRLVQSSIFNEININLDVSHLLSGFYFLKIHQDNQNGTFKVVKI